MRAFIDVVRFELRLQLASPLFLVVLLLFVAIHLLAMAQVGIHVSDNQQIQINSAYLIVRTELVLSIFGMLPSMLFVVNAATRDHERHTVELFHVTPVPRLPFVLGRFSGGALCALLVGLAGLLGTIAGTQMPWLDPARVAPFSPLPYVLAFGALVAPSLLIVAALTFSVASITRSAMLSFAVAMVLVVTALVVNNAAPGGPAWLPLLDPFGALPIEAATRYWSIAELNAGTPLGMLAQNRALWLGLALLALGYACSRFHLQLPMTAPGSRRPPEGAPSAAAVPRLPAMGVRGRFGWRCALAQLQSQARMDLRAVFVSPLMVVVLLLVVIATVSESSRVTSAIMNLPLHPQTALMLGFFRYGLFQFVLLVLIFYAGTLIHREREHGLGGIVGASPHPDWLLVVSKTLALLAAVCALLVASMLTSIARQRLAGHSPVEVGLYVKGLFIYNGFYFGMLGVLALVIQVLSPGKWTGMVLVVGAYAALLSMESLGLENLLYGFRIPFVVYSDLNGFGHFRVQTVSLIIYWTAGCVLLMVLAHLFFPRGSWAGPGDRRREAGRRMTRQVIVSTCGAATAFTAVGGWIYYNTHVLNRYETVASRVQKRADYERRYGRFRNQPGPSVTRIALDVDLYPDERRLESRGRITLLNRRTAPLTEFVVSVDPRLVVKELNVPGASIRELDTSQGFYRLSLAPPLQPGAALDLSWAASRHNRGFVNSEPDNEIVANGTFVDLRTIMPVPAYDDERDLLEPADRARHGLAPASRLPTLGDPAYLNTVGSGVDGRADFRVVFSTSGDQIAVAPGALTRQWTADGRHYFEYEMERPTWPIASLTSARYVVARDRWNGVGIEIYHDPRHSWNVPIMLDTSKKALAYFSREFAPYPLSQFRIVEYPRYRGTAQAFPGTVPYSESAGFLTDLRGWASLDYATVHELAHQWWGGLAYGARMQGRQMLNETLAQYSTLMVFKEYEQPVWLRQILASTLDAYLRGRSRETAAEQPLMLTEDQGNVSYNKGALAMFALQDRAGADTVNGALRAYLARFAMKPPPYPTSRDLVNELRAAAGPAHQALITDLFERIVLYDVRVGAATARRVEHGYEVLLDIDARQFEADGGGVDTEVPLGTWFDVVIFPAADGDRVAQTPLYQARHLLHSGRQQLSVRVAARPGAAGVDPFHLMIDRTPDDNLRPVTFAVGE
ncbi:MAG TPA: M1 family aminopeptidase [Vicinamibacterales bacterium]|nr:M1 family aminopeptidase [Vicinamibacterales bacterium]